MALSVFGALNMHRGSLQGHLQSTMHPKEERISPRSDEGDSAVIQASLQNWMASEFFARTRLLQQSDMTLGDESNDPVNKQHNDFDQGSKKRRKQTKPVRIREEGEFLKVTQHENREEEEMSQSESGERSSVRAESNGSSEVGKFVCPYCSESLATEPQLVLHFQEQHVNKLIIEQLQRHQLDDQMVFHQQQMISQGQEHFNPYRYPLPSSWRKEPESPEPPNPTGSPNRKQELKLESHTPKIPFPFASDKLNASGLHGSMLPYPPNPFMFPFAGSSSSVPPSYSLPQPNGPQIRIFNPEAYCELCNKEFCNKYFLKTHKANKHGIYSDVTTPSQGSQHNSSFQHGFQQLASHTLDSKACLAAQQLSPKLSFQKTSQRTEGGGNGPEQPLAAPSSPGTLIQGNSTSALSSLMKPGLIINRDAYCELCQKEFCNKSFLKRHKFKIHGIQDPTSTSTTPMPRVSTSPVNTLGKASQYPFMASEYISSLAGTSIKSEHEETEKEKKQKDEQGHDMESNLDPERLREIGVQDPEAFCTFCLKEFCNKEMLKIHKWKKHGVPLKESAAADQSLPLDLTRQLEGSKHEDEQEQACQMCNMRFQNQYLLQMHESYFHSLNPEGVVRDFSSSEVKHRPESNDDLQKLQSMIKDLSGQDLEKTVCKICRQSVEKKHLSIHMLKEHGALVNAELAPDSVVKDLLSLPKESRKRPMEPANPQTFCQICKKDFFAVYFLQVHMQTVHSSPAPSFHPLPLSEGSGRGFVDRMSIKSDSEGKKRNSSQPPRSYCEICNKELCNKYFMKTHMLKMHGIYVENGSPLQGVSCDICQKELSSKYFLKVHKQNAHGIFEDIPVKEEHSSSSQSMPQEFCPLCQKPFKSPKSLKAHLTQDHGDAGREAWHIMMLDRQKKLDKLQPLCGSCGETFADIVSLQVHIIKHHPSQQTSSLPTFADQSPFDQPLNAQNIQSEEMPTASDAISADEGKKTVSVQKFRCKKCSKKFTSRELCVYHLLSKHRPKQRVSVALWLRNKQPKFRCKTCGYQTKNMSILRLHIRHRHRTVQQNYEDLPKSVAVPQRPTENGSFHMQAFLMAEPINESASFENSHVVPSVVYLPVSQKISAPVSITFTLTPAHGM